jgi:hypothetical protein
MFSSREIAVALWLVIGLTWFSRYPAVRKAARNVVRSFLAWKILVSCAFLLAWTSIAVWLLFTLGMWTTSLLKDTILWFCFGGFVMMFSSLTAKDDENIFGTFLRDSVKIVVVLEFLVSAYTFSLPIELVLVPALTFVGMIQVVADSRQDFAPVARLTGWIQAIAGFVIVGYAIRMAVSDYATLRSLDTARQILLTPILSVILAPAVYILLLVSAYETLFMRVRLGKVPNPRFYRVVRRRLIQRLGFRVGRVRIFTRRHAFEVSRAKTQQDLDLLFVRAGV